MESVLEFLSPRMFEDMNDSLLVPFTKQGIEVAINHMHPIKAPRLDGMPVLFYQKFWSVVGNVVFFIVLDVLNNNASLEGRNHTLISLLPKVSDLKRVSELRLNSL